MSLLQLACDLAVAGSGSQRLKAVAAIQAEAGAFRVL
jgi:hypothetical protein